MCGDLFPFQHNFHIKRRNAQDTCLTSKSMHIIQIIKNMHSILVEILTIFKIISKLHETRALVLEVLIPP